MNAFIQDIKRTAAGAPRIYFAPLIGAVRAVSAEWKRIEATRNPRVKSTIQNQK